MRGIFKEESWTSYKTIESFTAPVVASTITGKTPEELGLKRNVTSFHSALNTEAIDDILFDYFDSYISVGRLIGRGPRQMPPSRRGKFKFLTPIIWNAVSNWDPDIFQYVGRKYSCATNDFWSLIWFHSFCCHGPFSSYTGEGPKECIEICNTDRLMKRLGETEPQKLYDWYQKGVDNAVATLRAIDKITGGMETIICFADHGEALGEELNGNRVYGHAEGMLDIPEVATVPLWINHANVKFPKDIGNLTLKNFIVECYNIYEKNNVEYNEFKNIKMKLCKHGQIRK